MNIFFATLIGILVFFKVTNMILDYKLKVLKAEMNRKEKILEEAQRLADEANNDPDMTVYAFYENPISEVPLFLSTDKDSGYAFAKEKGLVDAVCVQTTRKEHEAHMKKLADKFLFKRQKDEQEYFEQNVKGFLEGPDSPFNREKGEEPDDDGWDENLYGERPEDSL